MARQHKHSEKPDLLWKEFFKDPSAWCDHRYSKNSFGSPDFRHTIRYESLWIHGWHNPSWVLVEMQRRASPNEDASEIHQREAFYRSHNGDFPFALVKMLKDCAQKKDLGTGSQLHDHISRTRLLAKSPYLASSLINMYAKCGMLMKAQQILQEFTGRDVVCWNAIVSGYIEQRQFREALDCIETMVNEGLLPNAVTFICILKACGNMGDVNRGRQIHEDIVCRGLLHDDIMLGTALVDMYAKCGALSKAQEVLEGLPVRTIVSWNALIAGYAQLGQCHAAWNCFEQIVSDGLSPDVVTFICILKACGSMRDIERGERVHDMIVSLGWLNKDVVLGNALVDMYAKCDALAKARQLLQDLRMRNSASWNALIGGYAQQGQCHEALSCFEWMQMEGQCPDGITFICTLKACGAMRAVDKCKQIYFEIASRGLLQKDIVLGNALLDVYSKSGEFKLAEKVLDELPCRDIVSWNALIAGYSQQEQGHSVLDCFQRLRIEGLSPDAITFISILKAYGSKRDIDGGKQIHEEILSTSFLKQDIVLGNKLVDMYARCGALLTAQEILEELPIRNVVSWSALIAGFIQQGQAHEALNCFERMQNEGLSPDEVTLVSILKACSSIRDIEKGIEIHEKVVCGGWLEKDAMLGTCLVDMYAKCGILAKAQQVLEVLPVRNVVSWSALIAGRMQQGEGHEALDSFEQMQNEGLSPNVVTFFCILKACGITGNIEKGKQIHGEIVKSGTLNKDNVLGDALVDMYAKCGALDKAHEVLEELPVRKVFSWNALIAGFTQQGQCHEALNCLQRMQSEGLSPNVITFVCILKACGSRGAIDKGIQIYNGLETKVLLEKHIVLGNALVSMYAKCGAIARAQEVLDELPLRNIVTWNALITGYALQGQGHEALSCFEEMQSEGLYPDDVTFLSVLSACTHSGLLDESQSIFDSMTKRFGIIPNVKHRMCMVVIFGYAGKFDDAMDVIKDMPSCAYLAVWLALLAACSRWGNIHLGRLAFNQTIQLEDGCGAAYVLMASTFTTAGMQEEAANVEATRQIYADCRQQESNLWVDMRDGSQVNDVFANVVAISNKMSQETSFLVMHGVS